MADADLTDGAERPEGNENDVADLSRLRALTRRRALFTESAERRDESDVAALADFREFFADLNATHFTADEFLTLGASHYGAGACTGLNNLPPRTLWDNVAPLVRALDAIRARLGHPVYLSSVYRDEAYNTCIGGVSASQHRLFQAADFVAEDGTSRDWARVVWDIRTDGVFTGGIGLYDTFVHVDVRGTPVHWPADAFPES